MKMSSTPLKGLADLVRELDIKIERHPNYADLRNMRGLARACLGNFDSALADLDAALESNARYHAAIHNRAWLYFKREEPQRIRAILATRGGQRLSARHRGHLKFLVALSTEGARAAEAVLEHYAPSTLPARHTWLELDRLWIGCQMQDWGRVDAQLERILEWIPDMTTHFREVGLLQAGSRGRQALALWSETFQGNPQIAAPLRECAKLCDQSNAAGLLHWGTAVSLDLCEYWMTVGTRAELKGRDVEAESDYRRAIDCDPRNAQPYIKLGLLHAACGRPFRAVQELEEAAALQPRYPDVRYMLGLLHEDLEQPDDAEAEYRNAIGIHPGYTMARLALGCLLDSRRADAEALSLLESVREAGVQSADVEERLASLYDRSGRPEDAIEARTRAREFNVSEA